MTKQVVVVVDLLNYKRRATEMSMIMMGMISIHAMSESDEERKPRYVI
jgi:hypothetical protein